MNAVSLLDLTLNVNQYGVCFEQVDRVESHGSRPFGHWSIFFEFDRCQFSIIGMNIPIINHRFPSLTQRKRINLDRIGLSKVDLDGIILDRGIDASGIGF